MVVIEIVNADHSVCLLATVTPSPCIAILSQREWSDHGVVRRTEQSPERSSLRHGKAVQLQWYNVSPASISQQQAPWLSERTPTARHGVIHGQTMLIMFIDKKNYR